jgi:hypothetical protein
VAVTTRTSNFFPQVIREGLRLSIGTWFGIQLPAGVKQVREQHNANDDRMWVAWRTNEWHAMPYDPDDLDAVFVAMKLTC